MRAACPKCRSDLLLVEGATTPDGPRQCAACGGFWVPAEALGKALGESTLLDHDRPPTQRPEGDRRTGLCPSGHGILRRARASFDEPFFLERCEACRGVWFDAGEWSRLKELRLDESLPDLWDPAHRAALTRLHGLVVLERDLRAKLGDELYERMDELVRRLENHPEKSLALAMLRERLTRAS